jgi:hypothetical protein
MQEATREFLGNAYARSNRSKLTRSSLKTLSHKFAAGENKIKSVMTGKSRRGDPFSHRSQADLLAASTQNGRRLPVTARELAKLAHGPGLHGDDPYSAAGMNGRGL